MSSREFIKFRSYRALLDEKREAVEKRLESFPPTVILSLPEGVYIFGNEIAKVHSTIVIAGAGQMFIPIADFFRGRLSELISSWGHNVPRANIEGKLILPTLFHDNLEASGSIVVADIVIVELGSMPENDYIARVDFLGKIEEFKKPVVVINYNARGESDDRKDNDDDLIEDKNESTVAEGVRKDTVAELVKLNLASQHALENLGDPDCIREFLEGLRANYPGCKGVLRRDLLRSKSFSWVYETL